MSCFKQDISLLKTKKLFLLDMDGTIYQDGKVFDGALELLDEIKRRNSHYVFITNNSSKSINDYIEIMENYGIQTDRSNFFTSTQATALYLQNNYPNAKVYCQGTQTFLNELKSFGINTTIEVEDTVDVVLVGFDIEMTSKKLRKTCEILSSKHDIPFIATNPDLRCPVDFGFIPDCGSICNMITVSTSRKPIYIGKPEATMVRIAMKRHNSTPEETLVIGDRLYTDIAAGLNAGVTTVCVLSGEATVEEIEKGTIKPTMVFPSIKEILEAYKN